MIKKHIIFNTVAVALLAMGGASCADDLNISSIDPHSSQSYDANELLAKQYGTLGLTGQKGPAGNGDMSADEGESGYYRTVFNLQELNTDEILWAWQDNDDIAPITNMAWTSSSSRCNWCYQRLSFDITLFNQFISEQSGKMDDDVIAEVRFLRALHYTDFLDLFHKAPFKDTFDGNLPLEKGGKDLYEWIDNELTAIEGLLKPVGTYNNKAGFGRADQGAAYALHARLALNSAVYTDGAVKDYQKAKDYCDKILSSGVYALSTAEQNGYSGYAQLFMGDNDENEQAMKEIIFPIRQDGLKTRQYGGSTMLVNSTRISGMPYYSQVNPWQCIFARKDLVQKFFPSLDIPMANEADRDAYLAANGLDVSSLSEASVIAADNALGLSTAQVIQKAGDERAMFYMGIGGGIRTLSPDKQITSFLNGSSIVKWSTLRLDGGAPHDNNYIDTDIPLFRLAEVYLTRAEAQYRLGNTQGALDDIHVIQSRAHKTLSPNITEQILIDEWCKEFYLEGRRRSDLVRFGLYTSSKYLWSFKAGQPNGAGVDSHYNVYPIPADEIAGNPNMTQNPGY